MASKPFSLSSSIDNLHTHHLLRHQPPCLKTTHPFNLISSYSFHLSSSKVRDNPPPFSKFIFDNFQKHQFLDSFKHSYKLPPGLMLMIREMQPHEKHFKANLVAKYISELMVIPGDYEKQLADKVRQEHPLQPNLVTLIAFHARGTDKQGGKMEFDSQEAVLAGTVDIRFDRVGINESPISPIPPKDAPFICYLRVDKSLRR